MGSMVEVVRDRTRRRGLVDDCIRLIEAEVNAKRGLRGMAVKAGYKAINRIRPGMVAVAMDGLLDEFAEEIDPFWQRCQRDGVQPSVFFSSHRSEIANALLSVTDKRAQVSANPTVVNIYNGLRGKAAQHIGEAMPRFSALVVKHAS